MFSQLNTWNDKPAPRISLFPQIIILPQAPDIETCHVNQDISPTPRTIGEFPLRYARHRDLLILD